MPRKEKKEKKEKATRKKISQKAIQTVVVNLDGASKRRRRGGRRRGGKSKPAEAPAPEAMVSAVVPPTVVYQTGYGDFRPPMNATIPVPATPTPSTVSTGVGTSLVPAMFQDVGVGTEGFVNILDLPTKREQLEMLGDIVPPAPKITMRVKETPAKATPTETLFVPLGEPSQPTIAHALASVDPNFAGSIRITPPEKVLAIDTKRKELGLPPTPIVGYQEGTGKPITQVQLKQEAEKAKSKAKASVYEPSPEFQFVSAPAGREPLMIFTPETRMFTQEEMAKSAATAAEYGLPPSNIVGISKSGIPITKPTKRVHKKKSE